MFWGLHIERRRPHGAEASIGRHHRPRGLKQRRASSPLQEGRPGLAPSQASVLGLEVAIFSLCFSDGTLPAQQWKDARHSCRAQSGRRPGHAGEERAQAQRNARCARAATQPEDPQSEPPLSEVRHRRSYPGGGRLLQGPAEPFRGADRVPALGPGAAFRAAFSW